MSSLFWFTSNKQADSAMFATIDATVTIKFSRNGLACEQKCKSVREAVCFVLKNYVSFIYITSVVGGVIVPTREGGLTAKPESGDIASHSLASIWNEYILESI